jgi:ribosome-binding factor A
MPAHRLEKINHVIRAEISQLLMRETKDPRLGGSFICINLVETTPDLRFAKVYVSCICDEQRRQEILDGLTAAAGFFRRELAKHLSLRRVPDLHFTWDESIERGTRVIELIESVCPEGENSPPTKTQRGPV